MLIFRYLMRERALRFLLLPGPVGEYAAQSEVCDLQRAIRGDEEVRRLQVAMHDAARVAVRQARQQHGRVAFDLIRSSLNWFKFY